MSPKDHHGDGERRQATVFERHGQTALTLIIVALVIWLGTATQGTQVRVAELVVEINNLKNVIRTPDARVNDLTRRIETLESLHWDPSD